MLTRITRRAALLALALSTALTLPAAAFAAEITVFAAASLKTALDRIAADWQAQTGNSVVISYDSSAKLAKQIEQGAPADIFISASVAWMDELAAADLIQAGSRKTLLGNSLILVAADKDAAPVQIDAQLDLAGLLGTGKLAMGLVESVPAGQYGKEALTTLGLWDAVAPNVAQADNVRAALMLVAAGEAAYGIVYASDAIAETGVAVVGTFPADSHSPILYPAALTASGTAPEAGAFLDALSSEAAAAVFTEQGFDVLK